MSEYCIELNEVTKKFGNFTAVDKVSLKLEPGKIYGFVAHCFQPAVQVRCLIIL